MDREASLLLYLQNTKHKAANENELANVLLSAAEQHGSPLVIYRKAD